MQILNKFLRYYYPYETTTKSEVDSLNGIVKLEKFSILSINDFDLYVRFVYLCK